MVNTAQDWPVARTYAGRDLARISLPLGGIGTGTVGFGGRGQFRDWELKNRPSKGLTSPLTFFACRVRGATVPAQARILEGALFDAEVEGWQGSPVPLAGLPRFAGCEFRARPGGLPDLGRGPGRPGRGLGHDRGRRARPRRLDRPDLGDGQVES